MCNCMEQGKCECCGRPATLHRTYFEYDLKCDCHNGNHKDLVRHCSACIPDMPATTTYHPVGLKIAVVQDTSELRLVTDFQILGTVDKLKSHGQ